MQGDQTAWYVNDHLGTPQRLLTADGSVVWAGAGSAFGETTVAPAATVTNPLRFPGQYFDAETGTHYNYFRDYEPQTGRYLQWDPIGLAGGINTYGYAEGSPVDKADPEGLKTLMCTKPLHALGDELGPTLYPESKWNPSPFYHQFVCISDGKGAYKCGGQDRREGPWSSGKPSDDHYKADQCKQVEPDNNCIERCIAIKLAGPRPKYGLFGPGTNCQEWADDAVTDCRKQCKKK